jgi:hypothetical protein
MKRVPFLLALALVLAGAGAVGAQDAAELERQFVDGLRSRGWSKLALEYLEKLAADPKLDPALKLNLPIEIARSRMSLAQESPLDERQALYSRARADLEQYAKANAGRPSEVQANLEIARIAAFQGKAQLSRAVRQESQAARITEASKAGALFEEAGKKLSRAVASLDAQMVKYKGSSKEEDTKILETLRRAKLQAEFDQAINLLLQSQALILSPKDAAAEKRGLLAQDAEKNLGKIAELDENNPLCQKAKVWKIPCFLTMDEPDKAREVYKEVSRGKIDVASLDARMLADYFQLALLTAKGSKIKKPGEQIRKDGTAWLKSKSLGSFGGTPDGYGVFIRFGTDFCFVPSSAADVKHAVKFEVAKELLKEARDLKNKTQAAALFKSAQDYLNDLQDTENDLTPQAMGLHLQVFIARRGGKIDPDTLSTFREFNFLVRYRTEQYREATKEEEKKAHLRDVAAALHRCLEVEDSRARRRDRIKAAVDLIDVYMTLDDFHRAAIYGEYLAQTYPESREATKAAAWALQAYTKIMAADAKLAKEFAGGADTANVLTDEVLAQIQASDRKRFHRLADYVGRQEGWQDLDISQYSRYQLALEALTDKDYAEAIPLLESLKSGWSGYQIAHCQLVFTAMRLTQPDATRRSTQQVMGFDVAYRASLSEAERKAYEQRALAAIKSMQELPAKPAPIAFHYHFTAKLEQCKLLYRKKNYAELDKVAGELLQQFNRIEANVDPKLDDQIKNGLRMGLETWQKYALVGLAEQDYKAGKLDAVLSRVGPLVTALAAKVARAKEAKAKMQEIDAVKDFPLQRDVLELAMRTYLRKNNIADAKIAFDLLQDLAGDPELTNGPTGIKPIEILAVLVLQLKSQIQELRLQGAAGKSELDKAIVSFTAFLDLMTKDMDRLVKSIDAAQGEGQKSLKPQILGLLARSYANLDRNKEAARLLAMITRPKDPTPDEQKSWLDSQILLAQVLIKSKQPKEAKAILSQKELKPQGKLTLEMIFLNLEVKKQEMLLLEAEGDYRKAMTGWGNYQKEPTMKSLLGDRNFERMLKRIAEDQKGREQKEIAALPRADEAKYKAEKAKIEGKYKEMQRRIQDRLESMYDDLVKMFFDAYYHKTYCVYKVSETVSKESTKAAWIKTAANLIVKLENGNKDGWKNVEDQFRVLLENEPALKQQYDLLKNGSK